jgi:mono/diheme cytochrome c family protein
MKASSLNACALLGALVVFQPVLADDQTTNPQGGTAPSANAPESATAAATAGAAAASPYRVVDGDKVDPDTLKGWRTWRAMACDRCHGPNQEGMVGPSLLQSLKVLTKDEFKTVLLNGRPEKGMPNFGGTQSVVDNLDNLYAFLKGRSDGAINPGKLRGIE